MLKSKLYEDQIKRWPHQGQHILAQFDDHSVVVYQAYCPAIGNFAAKHGYFGGDFKLSRMSWIKTNFLWMMYRCGWGTKIDQEVTLAITLRREAFDTILEQAVHSTFIAARYGSHERWKQQLATSSVRLQWDPDHDPFGAKQNRRALQLGLSGDILRLYSRDWILNIENISAMVAHEREHCVRGDLSRLSTPKEETYPVTSEPVARHLEIDVPVTHVAYP